MSRTIVHLDADAFFASVEQSADSRLRGKPIAVSGESRGIIASASYEARKFGIYTPMPTARARKLCPKLIVLPGDYERYEQFSNWMFGNPAAFPHGRGPQGDVIRINNFVRCVRDSG
jgi:DNA polymerase-4